MEGKKIAVLMIFCCLLIQGAAAYLVTLSAPQTVNVGEPIIINGSSNLPPGFSTMVVLSRVGSFGTEDTKEITIQQGGLFFVSFETNTLKGGEYKVEIEEKQYPYDSDSKRWLFIDIIDRINELKIITPVTQVFDGTLDIGGTIDAVGDSGMQMEAIHENTTVFGPIFIPTRAGAFQEEVPIKEGGIYTVNLVDNTSYQWTVQFQVSVPTPGPITTSVTPESTAPAVPQASAVASRAKPAYFKVDTTIGTLHASTSSGVDWVMEYIDESGGKDKINVRGTESEEITLSTKGGTVYFKIYPDRFEDQATVILYVENVQIVETCPACAAVFGDATPTTTEASLPGILGFLAILAGIGLWLRRS